MRKLPNRETKQSKQKNRKSKGKKEQHQTRASKSLGWDAANDLLDWLWLELEMQGITNETLSAATGISVITIQSWQKTERIPSLENFANCAGFLGYEILPMRGIVQVQEGVYYHPVAEFRRKLLTDKLASKARAEGKSLDQYIAEQSSEEAKEALISRVEKSDRALAEENDSDFVGSASNASNHERAHWRRQIEAAKADQKVRLRFRWNG